MEGGGSHGVKKSTGSTGTKGTPTKDDCDIRVVTVLNRVDSEVLSAVVYGASLAVDVIDENGTPRLITSDKGKRVGDINDANALQIAGCIAAGNRYVACVIEKRENYCKVRIQPD